MGRKILFDGKIIFRDNIKAGIDSPALNYGYGLFETILYENEKIYFVKDHLTRLFNSCNDLKITSPDPNLINEEYIYKLIKENGLTKNSIKIKLMYLPITSENEWNTIVRVNKYERCAKDVDVLTINEPRTNSFFKHKSMSYMQNHHSLLRSKDYNEILFVNKDDNIIEGSYSNIIAIKENSLYFVDENNDCLFGIMQQNIIKDYKLFGFEKIESIKKGFSKEFLESCDEVLLTNSLKIASNIKSITFGNDKIEYKSCKIASIIRDHYLKTIDN